jgi:hypothetical protein
MADTAAPQSASPPCTGWARLAELSLRGSPRATPTRPAGRTAPVLTHHQIIELAAPFVRCGHAVDLAASDRLRRRLVFRSRQHGAALSETLQLESARPGYYRLTRLTRLTPPTPLTRPLHGEGGALQATLQAEGPEPAELLARIQAVPLQRHFSAGPGFCMASSGRVAPGGAQGEAFEIAEVVAETNTLVLRFSVPQSGRARSGSALVELAPRGSPGAPPPDLLAVLGWDWSLLQAGAPGWQGSVRLRGARAGRGVDAEDKMRVAAAHLAQTLAEPPRRFHERLRTARWRVLARHALPALACALLACEAAFADTLRAARDSPLTLALMCLPPACLLLFLVCSERPRMALPAWPRMLPANAWQAPP